MQASDYSVAKAQVGYALLEGCSWREAVQVAGVQMNRATAYRLRQRMLAGGEEAVHDRRQGHASKVRRAVRTWLEGYYQHHPRAPGKAVQALLEEQYGVWVSVTHLNRLRAALSGATRVGEKSAGGSGRMEPEVSCCWPPPRNQIGCQRWRRCFPPRRTCPCRADWRRPPPEPGGSRGSPLLFLGVVGLHRPWDLRGYAQEGLALLTTQRRAYGYRTAERFLSQVAQAGGAEALTDALACWTTRLWKLATEETQPIPLPYYVDGHRKPVFSDYLLPRGMIGRTGKVLGCRTLLLLHDDQGHPLLATTHRGDLYLTQGTPSLLTRYEAATDEVSLRRLVIDREGMAAEFLAKLAAEGRAVVTILRTEQYRGLTSFTDVGAFLPVARDRAGQVIREVAPARFLLPLPEHTIQRMTDKVRSLYTCHV
jgi:transposase